MKQSCEMDIKVEIKDENPLSEDETECFTENVTMKTNSDAVLLDDCDKAVKTETKSESPFPDFCSQKEKQCDSKHLIQQIRSDTVAFSSNYKIHNKIEIGSQSEREILPEDPVMKNKKYNSDHEKVNKIEIKAEPWWPVSDDLEDGTFTPVKSSRSCTEAVPVAVSGDSTLHSTEVSGKNTIFGYRNDFPECENRKSDVTKISPEEKHVCSEQPHACIDEGDIYSKASVTHKGERSHKCNICENSFTLLSSLKRHYLIHEGKKPHKCDICEKSFSRLSHLKTHNLMHEGIKPHKCKICDKSFVHLSSLKTHKLKHEGRKPHKCRICEKTFAQLYKLKSHNLIHEGKKPHKCKICEKSFTLRSTLNRHNLIHEGIKSYKCEICEKSFTQSSHLKLHNLMHEGKKPHKCGICDKSFTQSISLKLHNWKHEGKKPYKCEICPKGFTLRSDLMSHNLIHEGKKPHKCGICDKSFTLLSYFKRHQLIHQNKKS